MIRCPSRSERTRALGLAAVALACACAGTQPLSFASSSALPDDEPRRPAGVAVDPAPELPKPAPVGSAETGLVVLKTPLDTQTARQVVKDFFRAAVEQDADRLEKLLEEQSYVQAGASMGRQQAQPFWRLRLSRLDYGSLAGQVIFRDAELEIYRSDDVARLRPARTLGMAVQGEDVLVRVPIATPRVGRTRLFGDEITFLLRPNGGSYKIVEMAEDFQLP
jgi:hypothetical protein